MVVSGMSASSSRTGITQKSQDESLLPCTLYSVLIEAQNEQFPASHTTPHQAVQKEDCSRNGASPDLSKI